MEGWHKHAFPVPHPDIYTRFGSNEPSIRGGDTLHVQSIQILWTREWSWWVEIPKSNIIKLSKTSHEFWQKFGLRRCWGKSVIQPLKARTPLDLLLMWTHWFLCTKAKGAACIPTDDLIPPIRRSRSHSSTFQTPPPPHTHIPTRHLQGLILPLNNQRLECPSRFVHYLCWRSRGWCG